MLRRSENSDIFLTWCLNWTDGCSRSGLFWMWEADRPLTLASCVLEAELPTTAALMNRRYCSGSHLRGTSLELASSVLLSSHEHVPILTTWCLKYQKWCLFPILNYDWGIHRGSVEAWPQYSLNLFSWRGKIYVLFSWFGTLWLLDQSHTAEVTRC